MASALSAVRDVDIDAEGTYKYVLIRVFDPEAAAGSADNRKLLVRGYAWAEYHDDIFQHVKAEEQKRAPRLRFECIGGGRIRHVPPKGGRPAAGSGCKAAGGCGPEGSPTASPPAALADSLIKGLLLSSARVGPGVGANPTPSLPASALAGAGAGVARGSGGPGIGGSGARATGEAAAAGSTADAASAATAAAAADAGSILVYGYSVGYGRADHAKAVALLRAAYPSYGSITCSNEGY